MFKLGDSVEALFGGGEEYFPGVVSGLNDDGTLMISYDDGDEELNVLTQHVRGLVSNEKLASQDFFEINEVINHLM